MLRMVPSIVVDTIEQCEVLFPPPASEWFFEHLTSHRVEVK